VFCVYTACNVIWFNDAALNLVIWGNKETRQHLVLFWQCD
jgi:hypothetical protein